MEISQMLKEQRKKYELTQEDLSEKIFVSKKTISNWETGKTTPDIDSLIRLAKLFDLSLDELLLEGSTIVEEMKKKEVAYQAQKISVLGTGLTNALLMIFLFIPGVSDYFYMSDAMYGLLLLIILANGYSFLHHQKEVKQYLGTDLEIKQFTRINFIYAAIPSIFIVIKLVKQLVF
ncbi:MAG: helix-turn-helix transcriptional regulator [Vagococcus sp.]